MERDLIHAVESLGLPTMHRQYPLRLLDGRVIHLDAAWPELRFALEPGASWWHRAGYDHTRDQACLELGWSIMRIDEHMMTDLDVCARSVMRAYMTRWQAVHVIG